MTEHFDDLPGGFAHGEGTGISGRAADGSGASLRGRSWAAPRSASKVEVILNLLDKVDTLLLGGGMIFTFFKVHGLNIGTSLLDEDSLEVAREILDKAKASRDANWCCPRTASWPTSSATRPSRRRSWSPTSRTAGWGWTSVRRPWRRYREILAGARSIFWNGPMGVFELPSFAAGTRAVGEAVAAATDAGRPQRRRRRRQRGGRQPDGPGRPDQPHLHRRRRLAGVHGGARIAGCRRPDRRLSERS